MNWWSKEKGVDSREVRENHLCDFEHLLGSLWKFVEDGQAVGSCRTVLPVYRDKEFDLSYELPRDYDLSIMLTKTFTYVFINYIYIIPKKKLSFYFLDLDEYIRFVVSLKEKYFYLVSIYKNR